jgi:osmoprotectant transport system permease protein
VNEQLAECLRTLPDLLGGHLLLALTGLAVGLVISVPLGLIASGRPKLAELALGVSGVVQTVPSVALLVLMVPLLGGAIGFLPAFVALTLYSVLPILANTVVGIRGVDPNLIEAARGLGMSERQMLFRVQLPLAVPVIISGIRTATVLVVGTATLVTPVGGVSLGNYIFGGLETLNYVATVFGCVLAALLAIVLDQLIRLIEVAVRRRNRPRLLASAAALFLVLAGGLYRPAAALFAPPAQVVASAPFTEQHILSEVLRARLQGAGFTVDQRRGMSEGVQFLALRLGKIDCCVNYTGNIWSILMKRKDAPPREEVYAGTRRYLQDEYGVLCLGRLGFENAYALAMRPNRARALLGPDPQAWTLSRLADVTRSQRLTLAADLQFFARPEWPKVRNTYALRFHETREMDPGLMYQAVDEGSVDVICAYTSDGRIDAFGLVVLSDPRDAFPPYDAVLLVSRSTAERPGVIKALRPLVGAIDETAMRRANYRVDVDNWTAARAARALLEAIEKRAKGLSQPAGASMISARTILALVFHTNEWVR